jgi:hypothetical protein
VRPGAKQEVRQASTLERLRKLEARLDDDLGQAYQRFERGDITARELDKARDTLIAAFNQQIMRANIRYRSMMRPRRSPVRRAG